MIKTTLMNQGKIAGIGNIYCDEILFQTGIHPKAKIKNISQEKREQMYDNTIEILETAIEKHADPEKLPNDYIIPKRDEEDAKCPKCNSEIEKIRVNGRGTYYCPECQEK